MQVTFPALAMVGVIVGFVAVIALYFKPHLAKFLGPVYAIAEGFFVGAISKVFEAQWNGIVVQAAGATIAVFAVMLALYNTRIIKVTDRFRRIVIFATLGVMALYLVSFVIIAVRRRDRRSSTTPRRSASASASSSAGWRRSTWRSTSTSSSGAQGRPVEGLRVGRRRRPARHHRLAVPRDPAPAGQAAPELTSAARMTDARRRRPSKRRPSTASAGGVARGRRRSSRRRARVAGRGRRRGQRRDRRLAGHVRAGAGRRASLAFVLDSTWAVPMTAAALVTHGVAAVQPGRGGYLADLSRRANRHVYARGLPAPPRLPRSRSATPSTAPATRGHDVAAPAPRRHRPRGRPRLAGPLVRPAVPAAVRRLDASSAAPSARSCGRRARRDEPFGKVVETCAYYLNPFEWWAYSRDGNWPPRAQGRRPRVAAAGACGRSARRRGGVPRPARPAPPAAPG